MVKCTKKIGIAQKRCRNVKGKAKKKKCLKRVMCAPKKRKGKKRRCPKGIVKSGPRKGRCKKVRRKRRK